MPSSKHPVGRLRAALGALTALLLALVVGAPAAPSVAAGPPLRFLAGEPGSLDPASINTAGDVQFILQLYAGLTRLDETPDVIAGDSDADVAAEKVDPSTNGHPAVRKARPTEPAWCEVRLFGPVEVIRDGKPLDGLPPRALEMLVYLVTHPGGVPKERLDNVMWAGRSAGGGTQRVTSPTPEATYEALEKYAREPNARHWPAWQRFNRTVASNGDVGIWHETYKVAAGQYECIYNNMPLAGLAKASTRADEPKANVNAEGVDAVKLMTIHAAKGLQFPIVFLPSLDEENRTQGSGPIVMDEDRDRIVIAYEEDSELRKTLPLFRREKEKGEEEEKRLFYVAVPRARGCLCMSGVTKKEKLSGRLAQLARIEDAGPIRINDGTIAPDGTISVVPASGAQNTNASRRESETHHGPQRSDQGEPRGDPPAGARCEQEQRHSVPSAVLGHRRGGHRGTQAHRSRATRVGLPALDGMRAAAASTRGSCTGPGADVLQGRARR